MRKALIPFLCLCGFASAEDVSGQMAGTCLDVVELGPWYPVEETAVGPDAYVPQPAEDYFPYAFPARVRLRDTPRANGAGFEFEIPENTQQTPHSHRAWQFASDTLALSLSTGFGGLRAKLLRDGRTWKGTVRTFTDNLGTLLYERALTLAPTGCGTAPPVAASEDLALPRAVELDSGKKLELGSELPAAVTSEPRESGWLTIVGEPEGPFAGADTVLVDLGSRSGRIANIELRYSSHTDLQPITRSLEGRLGPGVDALGTAWENRTTRVWIVSEESQHPRLRLTDPRFAREF